MPIARLGPLSDAIAKFAEHLRQQESTMQVSITITPAEAKFLRSFCVLRPMKAASALIDELATERGHADDIIEDLDEAGPIFESIRTRLVEAIAQTELTAQVLDKAATKAGL